MKLARIILPERDNDNQLLNDVHFNLRHALILRYGGCTMTKGQGSWMNACKILHEPVVIYDVAMERADVQSFRQLAREIAADARQECVMIVTPQGDVEFMKPLAHQEEKIDG